MVNLPQIGHQNRPKLTIQLKATKIGEGNAHKLLIQIDMKSPGKNVTENPPNLVVKPPKFGRKIEIESPENWY